MLVRSAGNFDEWRDAARRLLLAGVRPDGVEWGQVGELRRAAGADATPSTPSDEPGGAGADGTPPRIARTLMTTLEALAQFRDAGRWDLMYRLAWRSIHESSRLMDDAVDPDVRRAVTMEKAIRRDLHKMHAFVRFREIAGEPEGTRYFAWFEPDHEILRRAASFFVDRFANMHWTIATPDGAAVWNGRELDFIEGPGPAGRPGGDRFEDLWLTYYRNICNVSRTNPRAMLREMPRRYWKNLPEVAEIVPLLRDGAEGFAQRQRESTAGLVVKAATPGTGEPVVADETPETCRRCDLWRNATQAVAGEGDVHAAIMLVGEQPGDEEDLRGRPFVGPAGKVLDDALAAANLDRAELFITNAVKHFKWEPRGKRRLHKKPDTGEIKACNVWMEREVALVGPAVIVALGASALRALTGKSLAIESSRREDLRLADGTKIIATYHPSAILRAEGDRSVQLRECLEQDLGLAARLGTREPPQT